MGLYAGLCFFQRRFFIEKVTISSKQMKRGHPQLSHRDKKRATLFSVAHSRCCLSQRTVLAAPERINSVLTMRLYFPLEDLFDLELQ